MLFKNLSSFIQFKDEKSKNEQKEKEEEEQRIVKYFKEENKKETMEQKYE